MSIDSRVSTAPPLADHPTEQPSPGGIDPRGPRVAAWLTTVVLSAVLLTGSGWLLLAQAAVFATGAFLGLRHSPYGLLYRAFVAPRLGRPTELEAEQPPRFAQGVGLVFAVIGSIGYLAGAPVLGAVATGLALAAAFLNAAFGFCLGCEMYLIYVRLTRKGVPA
ncbi:MAG: DUF4395 domain-containing protein [Mycobacteriales bacterium]